MNADIAALPLEERLRLVEDIWDSIAAEQSSLPLTASQKALLDQRLDAYQVDGNKGRPAAAVIEELKRKL